MSVGFVVRAFMPEYGYLNKLAIHISKFAARREETTVMRERE